MKFFSIQNIAISLLMAFVLSGCGATQAKIKVADGQFVYSEDIKSLAVEDIKDDNNGLKSSFKTEFSKYTLDDKKYYQLFAYDDSNVIPANTKTVLSTKILERGVDKRIYKRTSSEYVCNKWKKSGNTNVCVDQTYLKLSCVEKTFRIVIHVDFDRVADGTSIYSAKYKEFHVSNECEDSGYRVETIKEVYDKLSEKIARRIVLYISPSYSEKMIDLMEKPDIKYTSKQKKLFDDSLILIKKDRMKEANEKLVELVEDTKYKSYVAFYNCGITFEALGDLENAFNAYNQAKKMSLDDNIFIAYRRVVRGMEEVRTRYFTKQEEAESKAKK